MNRPHRAARGADAHDLTMLVADALSGSWLDRVWDRDRVLAFIDRAATTGGVDVASLRRQVALRMLRDPELLEYPPSVAIQAVLERLLALAPMKRASLWGRGDSGDVVCLHSAGVARPREDARLLARRMLEDGADAVAAAPNAKLIYAPVMRWQQRHAVLISEAKSHCRDECMLLATEAAATLAPIIERDALLRRNEQRERALVSASERQLERLGLDLHDHPIQDACAMAADLRLFSHQLSSVLGDHPNAATILGRIEDLQARLDSLHADLREMSETLASPLVLKRPLGALIEGEARAFRSATDIALSLDLSGDLDAISTSQRVAILRIVQEALSNVREHGAHATQVTVRVSSTPTNIEAEIADDGCGFDLQFTIGDAARRGRLGLVGMMERVRLLGGMCDIHTAPGAGTRIELRLPLWSAERAESSAGSATG